MTGSSVGADIGRLLAAVVPITLARCAVRSKWSRHLPTCSHSAYCAPMGTRVAGEAVRRRYTVTGVVQGVGFRPFVHRIAAELGLSGFVGNAAGEVFVEVQGGADAVAAFADRLVAQAPPLARIAAVVEAARPLGGEAGFAIVPSRDGAGRHADPAGRRVVRRLPAGAVRPHRSPVPPPVHHVHELRSAVHDHHRAALRPPGHHDGGLPDVRGLRGGVRRTRPTAASTPSRCAAPTAARPSPSGHSRAARPAGHLAGV